MSFLAPAFLIGLLALPLLWWLLRAAPPAPKTERFPGVRVLLGLEDRERTPERTPLWLLLLRMAAAAALLLAFAQPVLNPQARLEGEGPLLVVMDGGWGDAKDWPARQAAAQALLNQADEAGRPAALHILADEGPAPQSLEFTAGAAAAERLAAANPQPWAPNPARLAAAIAPDAQFETVWLHDGLDHPGVDELARDLSNAGRLTLIGPQRAALALAPARLEDGEMLATALRAQAGPEETVRIAAIGRTVDGAERQYAAFDATFPEDELSAQAVIDLPNEVRNRLTRLELTAQDHAGAVSLLDDRLRRKTIALISGEREATAQPLLSGLHYLRAALAPHATYRETTLIEALGGEDGEAPIWADAIVLADIGQLDPQTHARLLEWTQNGGLLIRFAGPQLAALAEQLSQAARFRRLDPNMGVDPLLPVKLRGGGRALSGAMSWSTPQQLRDFAPDGPLAGLVAPDEVAVRQQVLAEPSADLPQRVWARLEDGTPLITFQDVGAGRVVLFHVTAGPQWSSLPLSGLFTQIMGRLSAAAPSLAAREAALSQDATIWTLTHAMDGYGALEDAQGARAPVEGAALALGVAPGRPPGRYEAEDASLALNVVRAQDVIAPRSSGPLGASELVLGEKAEFQLKPWLLAFGLGLLLIDVFAALFMAGRLRSGATAAAALAAILALGAPAPQSYAQEARSADVERVDPAERRAALETILAYVRTGDERVDRVSAAGLRSLSEALFQRTAIEPDTPAAIDLEADELSVYAILYWPITRVQPDLSDEAIRKLNNFARTGGLLIIDTQDAHRASPGGEGPNAHHLRRLVGNLDLPPLAPAPADHTLLRSFYLLDDVVGRWGATNVWVEAVKRDPTLAADAAQNANDGVSPVILGGVDWAGAWARDDAGRPMFHLGADSQRLQEMAIRFGVNVAMYAFTGNYKSDQVHLPTLLQRLGN